MTERELLFTQILNCSRADLYLERARHLEKDKSEAIAAVLKRRIKGEPLEYILGRVEFMGFEFKVTPDVLIPRPETEILVETVLKIVSQFPPKADPPVAEASSSVRRLKILDLGTGSGCIAVSLAKVFPDVDIDAVDISEEALEVAKANAEFHAAKINFMQADLFSTLHLTPNTYDLIISNPPYVASGQIEQLPLEVKCQPRLALDGGEDGLDFYRRIIQRSPDYLKAGGYLILEMGFTQKEAIENIFHRSPEFKIIEITKDYSNIDRVVIAQRKKENG